MIEGRREIRYMLEVCRGRRFYVQKDIRQTVLPFVRYLSIIEFILSSLSHQLFVKSDSLSYTISLFFLSSDIFYLLSLQIKVLCSSVTKNQIHSAHPTRNYSIQNI